MTHFENDREPSFPLHHGFVLLVPYNIGWSLVGIDSIMQ